MTLLGRKWGWVDRFVALAVVVIAAILVGLLVVTVLDSIQSEHTAISSLATARELSSSRITLLDEEIEKLSRQSTLGAKQRGQLLADVKALQRQLRRAGVEPVVRHAPEGTGDRSKVVVISPLTGPTTPPSELTSPTAPDSQQSTQRSRHPSPSTEPPMPTPSAHRSVHPKPKRSKPPSPSPTPPPISSCAHHPLHCLGVS